MARRRRNIETGDVVALVIGAFAGGVAVAMYMNNQLAQQAASANQLGSGTTTPSQGIPSATPAATQQAEGVANATSYPDTSSGT